MGPSETGSKGGNEEVLSYQLPWAALPGDVARAGLLVALLHVWGLVQDVTAVVDESLAIWSLAQDQPTPPPSSTRLGALYRGRNSF